MGSKFNLHVRISEEKNNSLIWLHKAALTMVVVAHVSDVAYGFNYISTYVSFYVSNSLDNFVGTLYNMRKLLHLQSNILLLW